MSLADSTQFFWLHENQRGLGLVPEKHGLFDSRALFTGRLVPAEPVRFTHNLGNVPSDLIMCGSPALLLISDRFRSVLDAARFTGWATYPVEATGKRRERLIGYSGLAITGRAGLPHWEFSERFTKRAVPSGPLFPALRGMFFEAETWDGSDFFLLGDTGFIVVTAAVQQALKEAHIRNERLERLSDYEMPEFTLQA